MATTMIVPTCHLRSATFSSALSFASAKTMLLYSKIKAMMAGLPAWKANKKQGIKPMIFERLDSHLYESRTPGPLKAVMDADMKNEIRVMRRKITE